MGLRIVPAPAGTKFLQSRTPNGSKLSCLEPFEIQMLLHFILPNMSFSSTYYHTIVLEIMPVPAGMKFLQCRTPNVSKLSCLEP